jgi:hypothetical protein
MDQRYEAELAEQLDVVLLVINGSAQEFRRVAAEKVLGPKSIRALQRISRELHTVAVKIGKLLATMGYRQA